METNSGHRIKFHIGKRVIKTAVAVLCCFLIYALRGHQGVPFNCAVAAIICMQTNVRRSWRVALNRMIGIGIGVFYGVVVVIIAYYADFSELWFYLVVTLGVVIVLVSAVNLKQAQVADFACVTFLSIVMIQMVGETLFMDVFNRILDTVVGIVVAITINVIELPKKRRKDVLFVANLDETLRSGEGGFSTYSVLTLNGMIQDGIKFTIFTKGTPATLVEFKNNIQLALPAIVMDGCALYDVMNNKYIMKMPILKSAAKEVREIAEAMGLVCCSTVVMQDVLLIYFDDFANMAMQEVYRRFRKSPYRNYICAPLPEEMEEQILCIKVLDEREKIIELEERLKNHPVFEHIRLKRKEVELEGFSDYLYLHVTNKAASRRNASEYLRRMVDAKEVVSFGNKKWVYDIVIKGDETSEVVRKLKQQFEVNLWKKI